MRLHLTKFTWAGLVCISIGVTVFASWAAWVETRNTRPLYLRVNLAPAEVETHKFRVNLDALYTLEIEAKKTIPFDTLNCLLGMSTLDDQTCSHPSVIKANWVLTSGAGVVLKGESDSDTGGAWTNDTISRELGSFRLKKGNEYTLRVEFLQDGRSLAPTDPHLKVEVHSDFYEGTMFTDYFLLRVCGAVVLLGFLTLVVSGVRWFWQRQNHGRLDL